MSTSRKNKKQKFIKSFWEKYGQAILIVAIVILSGWLGFRMGEIKTENNVPIQMSINNLKNVNPAQEKINIATEALKRQGVDLKLDETVTKTAEQKKDCVFVASRKSHKFHTADCKYGKNIKTSNKVCFKSMEEARQKGYIPAKGCLGDKAHSSIDK